MIHSYIVFKHAISDSYRMYHDCEKRIVNIMHGGSSNKFEGAIPVIYIRCDENHSHYS
jgi:hypothetical protein